MSGSRVLLSLMDALKNNKAKYGIATLCNGGGFTIKFKILKSFFERRIHCHASRESPEMSLIIKSHINGDSIKILKLSKKNINLANLLLLFLENTIFLNTTEIYFVLIKMFEKFIGLEVLGHLYILQRRVKNFNFGKSMGF